MFIFDCLGGRKCGMELDGYGFKNQKKCRRRGPKCDFTARPRLFTCQGPLAVVLSDERKRKQRRYERTHSAAIVQNVMGCEARPSPWAGRSQPGVCALSTRCSHLRRSPAFWLEATL